MTYLSITDRGRADVPGCETNDRIRHEPSSLAARARFLFLLFLLVVLGLAVVLIVDASSGPPRDAAAVFGIAALAGLSVWRHLRLPSSVVCDVAGALLIVGIGWGMPQHPMHVFGLAFVHLFARALDVSMPRVALNAVLHPAAYLAVLALEHGPASLLVMDTATNLVGFAFVAGLMHTLAKSFAAQEQMEAQMNFQAFHDGLTGLPNRALFGDRLAHVLARTGRDGSRVALAFIDLDDFKDVNDSFGHAVGDQLLTELAKRISSPLRASDTAARLGGDEFALILEDVHHEDQAIAAAARVLAGLRQPFTIAGRQLLVSASVGIAVGHGPDGDIDELLRHADVAMYAAKAAGKGRCELYDPAMEAASHRQFKLAAVAGAPA